MHEPDVRKTVSNLHGKKEKKYLHILLLLIYL